MWITGNHPMHTQKSRWPLGTLYNLSDLPLSTPTAVLAHRVGSPVAGRTNGRTLAILASCFLGSMGIVVVGCSSSDKPAPTLPQARAEAIADWSRQFNRSDSKPTG